jgi:hypothetical protein
MPSLDSRSLHGLAFSVEAKENDFLRLAIFGDLEAGGMRVTDDGRSSRKALKLCGLIQD